VDSKRLNFQKWDILAIAGVLLCAVLVFLLFLPGRGEPAVYAEIYLEGVLVRTVDLRKNEIFSVQGIYLNVVEVKDGKIAITHSDCPGEDCVHSGWTDTSGRSIVCLPNALEIRVVADHDDVDFVVR